MHLQFLAAAAPLVSLVAGTYTTASTSGTDLLYAEGLVNLAKYEAQNPPASGCSIKTGYVRKEWFVT